MSTSGTAQKRGGRVGRCGAMHACPEHAVLEGRIRRPPTTKEGRMDGLSLAMAVGRRVTSTRPPSCPSPASDQERAPRPESVRVSSTLGRLIVPSSTDGRVLNRRPLGLSITCIPWDALGTLWSCLVVGAVPLYHLTSPPLSLRRRRQGRQTRAVAGSIAPAVTIQ